jgi:arylsulfatase A-like enzyme
MPRCLRGLGDGLSVTHYGLLTVFAVGCGWFESTPPDVILITIDTLRADHVQALNPDAPVKTPNISSIATDGVVFTQAFSPISVTAPAFASVMTGLEPGRHGLLMNLFRGGDPLQPGIETLAERFSMAGYKTGAFVSGYTLRSDVGLRQGFDVYNALPTQNRQGMKTAQVLKAWLGVQQAPTFTWFHSYDPHGPVHRWITSADSEVDWVRDPEQLSHFPQYQRIDDITDVRLYQELYGRGVEYADRGVGSIIDMLKSTDRYENSLVIVLSDHGETFDERELWFDHGYSTHAEQLHVPMIIKYPRNRSAGTKDERLVSLLDVAPTVLDVAGLPALTDIDGKSLTGTHPVHAWLAGESSHCKRVEALPCSPHGGTGKELSIRTRSVSMMDKAREGGSVVEVFDRTKDPQERHPVKVEPPAKMLGAMDQLRTDRRVRNYAPLPSLAPTSKEDAETRQLRALGYVE